MGAIFWNGVPSFYFGIQIERFPSQGGPERLIETVQIPGRNGALTIDSGAFANYNQTYEVYFNANEKKTPTAAREVKKWLQLPVGYQRLEDTYEPEVFRLARFTGPIEIENIMNLFGRAALSFDCQPQKWLKSGEFPIVFSAPGELVNDGFPSLPLIRATGNGSGILYVGSYTIQINALDGFLMLDSAVQDVYKDTQNRNNAVSIPEFPVLKPGKTPISWTGGISSVEIIPRWWML